MLKTRISDAISTARGSTDPAPQTPRPVAGTPTAAPQTPRNRGRSRSRGPEDNILIGLPEELHQFATNTGWSRDARRHPVRSRQQKRAKSMPTPRYDPHDYPPRTTWERHGGRWQKVEDHVRWAQLPNPTALLFPQPASRPITVFHPEQGAPPAQKRPKQAQSTYQYMDDENVVLIAESSELDPEATLTATQRKAEYREIPWHRIPDREKPPCQKATEKEGSSWLKCESAANGGWLDSADAGDINNAYLQGLGRSEQGFKYSSHGGS